jgi:hypothetical protein
MQGVYSLRTSLELQETPDIFFFKFLRFLKLLKIPIIPKNSQKFLKIQKIK